MDKDKQQPTVLIVEDDQLMRASLVSAFSGMPVNVMEAADGKVGLAAALAEHPDLIILDVAMPELDGISLMRRLRRDGWGKSAVIILLTSIGGSDMVMQEVTKLNPALCLMKDRVNIDEVVAKAQQLLDLGK